MSRLIDADALLEVLKTEKEEGATFYPMTNLLNLITNAPTVQREGWVSVEDRFPEYDAEYRGIWVLGFYGKGKSSSGWEVVWFDEDGFNAYSFMKIDYWKYLTEPAAPDKE